MNQPVRNSRIKLSQGQIFWREVGKGITLVFLHGTWCDGSQWLHVMEYLSAKYHCFAPDLLGFGDSEQPQIHYSIELEVECLAEYFQALRLNQVYLVADGVGSWIAASYALQHGEQVRGLILLSPEGVEVQGKENSQQYLQQLMNRPMLIWKLLGWLRPLIQRLGWQARIDQDWQQRENFMRSPAACQLMINRRTAEINAESLQTKLPDLKVPTLILQGEQATASVSAKSRTYAHLIPNSQLKIVSQGETDLLQSVPDAVAAYVRDFVNGY